MLTPMHFYDRLDAFAAQPDQDTCWPWPGQTDSKGYCRVTLNGRTNVSGHRTSYERYVGPIPDGAVLDHLCRNRACLNPRHLQPVDHRTNILRGEGVGARNAAKTHCPKGHPYTPENLRPHPSGGRYCRECSRAASRDRHARIRSGLHVPKSGPRTHCRHGHPWTPDNVVDVSGQRHCRTCLREKERRRRLTGAA